MAHTRSSSSPPENGPRPHAEQKAKTYPRSHKPSSHRGTQEAQGQTGGAQNQKRNNYEQDACQEQQWEKGSSDGSRCKAKSAWRPIREVLNVDTVLSELEQRRQQQQDSPRHGTAAPLTENEAREAARCRDERKQKCLMTIYEDEQRHETESHSSVESESRAHQQRAGRLRGGPKALLRSDTWTIQRTESGYESSDRLSSGSTNPDSPGVDCFAGKEPRSTPDGPQPR